MKTSSRFRLATAAVPLPDVSQSAGALRTRLARLARALRGAYLQVFGIPDYERYTAHMASRHPGDPVLARREFFIMAIDRKYRGSGPRCC